MKRIPLTQGLCASIDDQDYDELMRYQWCADKIGGTYYAERRLPNSHGIELMHRRLLGLLPGDKRQIDHVDHNGLNNTRVNLRIATSSLNLANARTQRNNTSGYRGVSWNKTRQKWMAYCNTNGRRYYLGLYADKRDAAETYNNFASVVFGEYAQLNDLGGRKW